MSAAPLTDSQVAGFARLALDGIVREYPNKPAQVYVGPESAFEPRDALERTIRRG